MVMPMMPPSISAGGGGPSASSSNAGVGTPISNPFNVDGSGWVVNFGNGNKNDVSGSTGANQTSQSPSGLGGAGLLDGLGLSGFDPKWLLLVGAVYFLARR